MGVLGFGGSGLHLSPDPSHFVAPKIYQVINQIMVRIIICSQNAYVLFSRNINDPDQHSGLSFPDRIWIIRFFEFG